MLFRLQSCGINEVSLSPF